MPQIKIDTTLDKIFVQVLTILNVVQGKDKLNPTEISLFSTLLYVDHKYKHLDKDTRDILLFSTESRKRMRTHMGISEGHFNNTMNSLRKKKFITKERLLRRIPLNGDNLSIQFNLVINEDSKSNVQK